jgi:hypothetical protein
VPNGTHPSSLEVSEQSCRTDEPDWRLEVVVLAPDSGTAEDPCDATLSVVVSGQSIPEEYEGPSTCHDGVQVGDVMTLSAAGQDALVYAFGGDEAPQGRVEFCRSAEEAPSSLVEWREGLFDATVVLWGPPAYGPSLVHMGWPPDDDRLGTSIVPH